MSIVIFIGFTCKTFSNEYTAGLTTTGFCLAENLTRPRLIQSNRMGNLSMTTSEILKEEDEPALNLEEHNYEIRSVLTENHNKDPLGRPVLVFDRWKILQSDIEDKPYGKIIEEAEASPSETGERSASVGEVTPLSARHEIEELTSSNEELSLYCKAAPTSNTAELGESESAQKEQSCSLSDSKTSIVRKPRPNSLAITSLSLDLSSIPSSSSTSDKEVCGRISVGQSLSVSSVNINFESSGLACRSASADALIETRPGLQQRRNKSTRPTSLQIPSIQRIPPPPVRTADQLSSRQNFTFNR